MRNLAAVSVGVLGLAAIAFLIARSAEERVISDVVHSEGRPSVNAVRPQDRPEKRDAIEAPARAQASLSSARESPASRDALDLLDPLVRDAKAGNAGAQYRVYEILAGCENDYATYYSLGEKLLDKEEAAARMRALSSIDEYAAEVYRMCHRLMQEQVALTKMAGDWLDKALKQGHPMAQATRASELIFAVEIDNPAAGYPPAPPNAMRDARALLRTAVRSGDPYALRMLGELRPALGGSAEETNKERWAMTLAACSRGMECGPEALWVKRYCKADPANLCPLDADAEAMIRSNTGSDFEMIKLRAREINELIDAGRSDELVP
jgi:hypothetical protein